MPPEKKTQTLNLTLSLGGLFLGGFLPDTILNIVDDDSMLFSI